MKKSLFVFCFFCTFSVAVKAQVFFPAAEGVNYGLSVGTQTGIFRDAVMGKSGETQSKSSIYLGLHCSGAISNRFGYVVQFGYEKGHSTHSLKPTDPAYGVYSERERIGTTAQGLPQYAVPQGNVDYNSRYKIGHVDLGLFYTWHTKNKLELYSLVGGGMSIGSIHSSSEDCPKENYRLIFAAKPSLVPLGFRYGDRIKVMGECGFGMRPLASLGLAFSIF